MYGKDELMMSVHAKAIMLVLTLLFHSFFFTNKNSTLSWARRQGIYSNREAQAQIVGAIFNELLELNQFEQQMYYVYDWK
jgi:hypothetical protein